MDTITGIVTRVIDGDTFDMKVGGFGSNNEHNYNEVERVRFDGFDAPEMNTNQGRRDQATLEALLLRKRITVFVSARDVYRRVVGKVRIH